MYKYIFLKVQNLWETNFSGKDRACLYMFKGEDNPFLRIINLPISWFDSEDCTGYIAV